MEEPGGRALAGVPAPAVLLLAAVLSLLACMGVYDGMTGGIARQEDAGAAPAAAGAMLALGALAMAWGFLLRRGPEAEALLSGGAWAWVWTGFVLADPRAWMVVPGLALPWLLLFVDVPARLRIVLLLQQWLVTAVAAEAWTGAPAATTLLALAGLLHGLLVWLTLPVGALRRVATRVLALLVLAGLAVTMWFTVQGPTVQRLALAAAHAAALAGLAWLERSPRAQALRLPTFGKPA